MLNFRALADSEPVPENERFGLAISGGGIRSATFALGVLQYLAREKLLSRLHYLSTVSGGGYIGSWLSAWINRSSMAQVEAALVPPPLDPPRAKEARTIGWLRQYGKFLSPELSLFSADTWLIATIWSRNTLLNLLLLLLFLSAVLAGPWILLSLHQGQYEGDTYRGLPAWVATAALFVSTLLAVIGLRTKSEAGGRLGIASALVLCIASLLQVFTLGDHDPLHHWPFAAGGVLGLLVGTSMVRDAKDKALAGIRLVLCIVAAAAGLWGIEWFVFWIHRDVPDNLRFLIPMLVPQVLTLFYALLVTFLIGLAGRHQRDELREWWSRVGAWMCIFGLGGLMLAGVSVFGPVVFFFVQAQLGLAIASGAIWTLATGAGVMVGRSPATSGDAKSKRPIVDTLLPLAPLIFVIGFLILVATGIYVAAMSGAGIPTPLVSTACEKNCETIQVSPGIGAIWDNTWDQFAGAVSTNMRDPARPAIGGALAAILFLLFGWLFDINEFSLHRFYRNRLVRAYQGASRDPRDADSFTNLSPDDDLRITALQRASGHTGPVHLVNTAVNLNASEAGLDERHAASFVFTPYGCGYSLPFGNFEHYQLYPADTDFRLGTPVTISGAAASPNMGSHTSAAVAFLLTLFNVRLGFWMRNTSRDAWEPVGPMFGAFYYIYELFALADRKTKYVYLSDGGHFENLAVYELLRRRCRYIICIDGEEDAGMKFEGLGELIRKSRSDLGVNIAITVSHIEERDAGGFSQRHCAVADIHYPDDSRGQMLYIKLSVTGDEPVDVLHYRKLNAEFPHQSTGDQFFSESQFESYRALGFHAAETAFRPVDFAFHTTLDGVFLKLWQFWKGVPKQLETRFSRGTEELMELLKQLGEDKDLWYLHAQFEGTKTGVPAGDPEYTKGFYFCLQLVQLMENVYVDLDLEANYANPSFAGWMEQFKRWKQSEMFQHTYEKSKQTFSHLFRGFYRRRL